jgi:hypothetical protein
LRRLKCGPSSDKAIVKGAHLEAATIKSLLLFKERVEDRSDAFTIVYGLL